MLSTENPPSDPPCTCEIFQLRSSDERASDKLALQEVDLPKSGLDYDDHHLILPKFSIRDYVFDSRSKDIKTNWPFSQKNLQLCLKHGVTDLLPPFQPLDLVRSQSFKSIPLETSLIAREDVRHKEGEPPGPGYALVSAGSDTAGCKQKVAASCVNFSNSRSEGDQEYPSTITNQSFLESNSVPTSKSPCLELEDSTFPEDSVEKVESAGPSASHKTEIQLQPLVKKCRLIVKLGKVVDINSNGENTLNQHLVTETMSSKVCPVCKTFSSSSNTTLNAHIDQCLSGESTVKWKDNSKEIKHRIKPRKTKLMVDIYATAKRCTLEELDRRNGTCWAANLSFPAQESDLYAECKDQDVSTSNAEDADGGGAVYIDSNGTKLRILSKFNDIAMVQKASRDIESKKLEKTCKAKKALSAKTKKKHQAQRHRKLLKLASHGKKFCHTKQSYTCEINGGCERNFSTEIGSEKEQFVKHCIKAHKQVKHNETGSLGRWVCSKRTSFAKKTNANDDHQPSKCNISQNLPTTNCKSSSGVACSDKSRLRKTPDSYRELITCAEDSFGMEKASYRHHTDDVMDQRSLRKKINSSTLGSRLFSCRGSMQFSKDITHYTKDFSMHGSGKDLPCPTENNVSSGSHKMVKLHTGLAKNTEFFGSRPWGFRSSRKNLVSSGPQSASESKGNLKRKCLNNSQVRPARRLDKEAMMLPSEMDVECDLNGSRNIKAQISCNIFTVGGTLMKIKKKRRVPTVSMKGRELSSENTESRSDCYGDGVAENSESTDKLDDTEFAGNDTENLGKDIGIKYASVMAIEGSIMSPSKSLHAENHGVPTASDVQCDTQQPVGAYQNSFCHAEPSLYSTMVESLGDAQDIFSSNGVENGGTAIRQHRAEVDSKFGHGYYYTEVEPIPIPGPPGSYLPSPGGTGSEDLQENSSLMTSKVQSSEDHVELMDRDSSNSPVSEASTISNSAVEKSEVGLPEKLPFGHYAAQSHTQAGFPVASVGPVGENSAPIRWQENAGDERIKPDGQEANNVISEKLPSSFKNDQPCCCSRKEGTFQHVGLGYQEWQLLRRKTVASLPQTGIGKQMNGDLSRRPGSFSSRLEMFSGSNYPSSVLDKMAFSGSTSYSSQAPIKYSAAPQERFPFHGDCDSASPSSSSVLRLMGKNLTVVSKNEDSLMQLRNPLASIMDEPPAQLLTFPECPPVDLQNEGYSFNHVVRQNPVISGQNEHDSVAQNFKVGTSDASPSRPKFKTPLTLQTASLASVVMPPSKNMGNSSMMASHKHEYLQNCNFGTGQGPKTRRETSMMYNMEKIVGTSVYQCRNAGSSSSIANEVIIIDDVSQRVDSGRDSVYCENMVKKPEISAATSTPRLYECDTRQMHPVFCSQQRFSSSYVESRGVDNTAFQMSPFKMVNESATKWNCTQGSLVRPSPLNTSPLAGHMRSTLYYSPSPS